MGIRLFIALIAIFYSFNCYAVDRFQISISIAQINTLLSEAFTDEYSYFTSSEIIENNKVINPRLKSTFHYVYDFDGDKENELALLARHNSNTLTLLVLDVISGNIKIAFKKDFKISKLYAGVFKDSVKKFFIGYSLESSFDYELKYSKGEYILEFIHDY